MQTPSVVNQLSILSCAERELERALRSATSPLDTAKALRNMGVVSHAAGGAHARMSNATEAVMKWTTAVSRGVAALSASKGAAGKNWTKSTSTQVTAWSKQMFTYIREQTNSIASQEFASEEGQAQQVQAASALVMVASAHFDRMLPRDTFPATRLQVFVALFRVASLQASTYLLLSEHRAAHQLLLDLQSLLTHCEQVSADAGVCQEELKGIKADFNEMLARAQSHLKLTYITQQININIYEQEEPKLVEGWQLLDDLCQNLTHVQALELPIKHYTLIEGETKSLLGLIWDTMLLDNAIAVKHYRAAMDIAVTIVPRPVDRVWYIRLRRRMSEIQTKVSQQEQADIDRLLASIKPKMDHLKELKNRVMNAPPGDTQRDRAISFLESVRDDLGLEDVTAKRLLIPEDRAEARKTIKKVVQQWLLILHPDRHSGHGTGSEHSQKVAMLTQVTAYLNDVLCCFKTD